MGEEENQIDPEDLGEPLDGEQVKAVTKFEDRMLRILGGVFGHGSVSTVLSLIKSSPASPAYYLTAEASAKLKDILSKGSTQFLAEQGWYKTSSLQDDEPIHGRLWERHAPSSMRLNFGIRSFNLLANLAQRDENDAWPSLGRAKSRSGDIFLHYLIVRFLIRTGEHTKLLATSRHSKNPLLAMSFPNLLSNEDIKLDFQPLLTSKLSWLVECLQGDIAEHWIHLEREKKRISSIKQIAKTGRQQLAVLTAFDEAVTATNRPDLWQFLFTVVRTLLTEFPDPRAWNQRFAGSSGRMAAREEAYRGALVVLHQFLQLRKYQQRFLSVGYFDEEYKLAQLWKENWEAQQAEELCGQVESLITAVDPMGENAVVNN